MERTRRIEKGDLIGLRRGDRECRGRVSGVKLSKDGYRWIYIRRGDITEDAFVDQDVRPIRARGER